ncbi:hypothetical protein IC757_12835 [Wenzhouxiangella sp. AB-CW3]|uniref:hypothetical protein n=1 Tax=Wenzhouxiangella sp. AB-CW3 TaxID=2771012 RepID=UPI00168ADD4B|nr:hypothetical protein [Wenzhouxiangella sp. AB-CW3]QOC21907.1 hypothetical protein IC757_12835 [Wenzhouxiangella sp. AB-CW3]
MGQLARQDESRAQVGWLVGAMMRMIRPLVRFAVGRISCSALVELVREAYVTEARRYLEAENPDKRVTTSALSLLCGMDGRAIKVYETRDGEMALADVCSEAAILEMWRMDESFIDPDTGAPARLLIHGPHSTFQRLVSRSAGRAVTPQTALDRLLESGNVRLCDDDTRVELVDPFFMPVEPSERTAIEAGSFAINRLGRAVAHNTRRHTSSDSSWLQQDRWTHRIPKERLEIVREDIRALIESHIRAVENHLEAEELHPSKRDECSIGVGWYYWENPTNTEEARSGAT